MTNNCNNLRTDGLPEADAETTEQTAVAVSSKLREKLRLSEPPLESAHRVRPRLEGRPRPVISRSTRPGCCAEAREDAPRNKHLPQRGSGPASRKMKTDPLPAVGAARANGKIACFVNAKLIIKEKSNDQDALRNTDTSAGIRQLAASSPAGPQATEMTASKSHDFRGKKTSTHRRREQATTRQTRELRTPEMINRNCNIAFQIIFLVFHNSIYHD